MRCHAQQCLRYRTRFMTCARAIAHCGLGSHKTQGNIPMSTLLEPHSLGWSMGFSPTPTASGLLSKYSFTPSKPSTAPMNFFTFSCSSNALGSTSATLESIWYIPKSQ
mmetsp:Transcript_2871/g.10395  ORF Transcript_2871/g.10395 Transcript_2871/m.10395 type:complete len:108 (+) Transcript_2871:316-639(+)